VAQVPPVSLNGLDGCDNSHVSKNRHLMVVGLMGESLRSGMRLLMLSYKFGGGGSREDDRIVDGKLELGEIIDGLVDCVTASHLLVRVAKGMMTKGHGLLTEIEGCVGVL